LSAQHDLKDEFKHPPVAARAKMWWDWVNGNVSRAGISADLEAMKRVGISEAEIFNVDVGFPDGQSDYLSPGWLDKLYFAASEARRLTMTLGFHNGAGWSSSGGPWVTPANAMQTVVYSTTTLEGGKEFMGQLPQPKTKLGFYKDIAVLAFAAPRQDIKIDNLPDKTLSGSLFKMHIAPQKQSVPANAVTPRDSVLDLSKKMDNNGHIDWQVPKGRWIVLRIGHTPTGAENHPAAKGGKGLECDKMSRTALNAYWKKGVEPIIEKLKPFIGTVVKTCIIDSYEVGCGNWTEDFRKEFQKQCGYDCLKYLPTLAGYYIQSSEISERFLWDFRKTIGQLMADNYYGYFSELCHKNGLASSVEPYGGPFESQRAGSQADQVMGEFWLADQLFLESPRLASSIAHLYGKNIVGAEAFTSFGSWSHTPASLKEVGDKAWAEGINSFTFHSFVHQPFNTAPGLTFGDYGMEMNRMNTWWEQSKAYFAFVARAQFLLQQGKGCADVLVFTGESMPNNGLLRSDIKKQGYDYDEISIDRLMSLYVKNGTLYTPQSGPYKLLILPKSRWATPKLLQKLQNLASAGALILAEQPERSPSLQNYPCCDSIVTKLCRELWPRKIGRLLSASQITSLLSDKGTCPDFDAGSKGADLSYIHRKTENKDIYFVANPQNRSRTEHCQFRVCGKVPEIWDPETGKITEVPVWTVGPDSTTDIPLSFTSKGCLFVVFSNRENKAGKHFSKFSYKTTCGTSSLLSGFKLINASYGEFLPAGVADVSVALKKYLYQNGLRFSATTNVLGIDPAQGSVKELKVLYRAAGKIHQLSLMENEEHRLTGDTSGFQLVRALYGKFASDFDQIPPVYPTYNVLHKIAALLKDSIYKFTVSDSLFELPRSNYKQKNQLRIRYMANGEQQEITVNKGQTINFEQEKPEPRLVKMNNQTVLVTPFPGTFGISDNQGKEKTVVVNSVTAATAISGPWNVYFPINDCKVHKQAFHQLYSWSVSNNDSIKYFSGTAIYKKDLLLPDSLFKRNQKIQLELGNVKDIAEIYINGKQIKTLWKAPFNLELSRELHPGKNTLEIQVTNTWTNHLIGAKSYQASAARYIQKQHRWPKWLTDGGRRKFFTTRDFLQDGQKPIAAGLLGPVYIRFYRVIPIENSYR